MTNRGAIVNKKIPPEKPGAKRNIIEIVQRLFMVRYSCTSYHQCEKYQAFSQVESLTGLPEWSIKFCKKTYSYLIHPVYLFANFPVNLLALFDHFLVSLFCAASTVPPVKKIFR
jgi:hypothetical protein